MINYWTNIFHGSIIDMTSIWNYILLVFLAGYLLISHFILCCSPPQLFHRNQVWFVITLVITRTVSFITLSFHADKFGYLTYVTHGLNVCAEFWQTASHLLVKVLKLFCYTLIFNLGSWFGSWSKVDSMHYAELF